MTFKMPCLTMKASIPRVTGLPSFKYEDLEEIAVVGQGSFGVVFKAKHRAEETDTVVVKKLCESQENDEDHKEFVKEARMLYNINHDNVVKFKAFCQKPYAIMLEYVYFDFSVFGDECDKKVHSLREFLVFVDEEQVLEDLNECSMITKIAKDVANGLCYLHSKDIVHRDLKTANVLLSNQHYSNMPSKEDAAKAFQEAPILCKVTDFGESRSRLVQTALVLHSRTQRLNRSTPVFLALEAFLTKPEKGIKYAINDVKKVDVWAYGMIVFNLINPDLRHPFQREFGLTDAVIPPMEQLKKLLSEEKKLCFSAKYKHLQATDWLLLEGVYHDCTAWDPRRRPTASEVVSNLETCENESLCENTPLRVSQTSSLEKFDREIAERISADGSDIPQYVAPANDGTNACAFLCAKIAQDLHMSEEKQNGHIQQLFTKLPSMVEKVISELPPVINKVRTMELYHIDETYKILRQIGAISCDFEFVEKILHCHHVFSKEARECLRNAIIEIGSKAQFSTAMFCCEPYVFLIGVMGEKLFLVDTHPVHRDLGGNGNGLLKVFRNCSAKACDALCAWIWKRLRAGGGLTKEAGHSFLVMSPEER